MSEKNIHQAFAIALQQGVFSGAQVCVGRGEEAIFSACYGTVSSVSEAKRVRHDTLFDVASLTKPVVTSTLAMLAVQRGQISLQDPVQAYLKNFHRAEEFTIEQLLSHTSGLPAWRPYYEICKEASHFPEMAKRCYQEKIAQEPLESPPGQQRRYSDLGFILLGFILEKWGMDSLANLFQSHVGLPWNLNEGFFSPLDQLDNVVATENCPVRRYQVCGEVHDLNAHALGGVAGHAGYFSTAKNLERFIHGLWRAWEGHEPLLHAETLRLFLGHMRHPKLGWDEVSRPHSQAGNYFSEDSFGHLAFTGCSLWMDPRDKKYIILLSNRVHPRADNEAIKKFRPHVHDLLVEELGIK